MTIEEQIETLSKWLEIKEVTHTIGRNEIVAFFYFNDTDTSVKNTDETIGNKVVAEFKYKFNDDGINVVVYSSQKYKHGPYELTLGNFIDSMTPSLIWEFGEEKIFRRKVKLLSL